MSQKIEHQRLQANGIELHLACQGEGPLVVMCHGYPGLWYSWRHQMQGLQDSYTVAALDTRGYNLSDKPEGKGHYALDKLVGAYPENKQRYIDRSPIHHVEQLDCRCSKGERAGLEWRD